MSEDKINHPKHYTAGGIETIDFVEAKGLGYHAGNIIKYISRYQFKGGLDDLHKARWYLNRLIDVTIAELQRKEDERETLLKQVLAWKEPTATAVEEYIKDLKVLRVPVDEWDPAECAKPITVKVTPEKPESANQFRRNWPYPDTGKCEPCKSNRDCTHGT